MGNDTTTAHSGSGDIRRGLELLWGKKEPPARGPKPGLTLEQIVRTAVTVADAEGLEAVSMRRVATDLGVGTMSLYRYVPGKSELLELMLDQVQKQTPESQRLRGSHWRTVLDAFGRGTWQWYLSHPWLLQVNQARPLLGPNAMAGLDWVLSGLNGLRLTDRERLGIVIALDGYVGGAARSHVQATQAAQQTGISDEEFWSAQGPFLIEAMATGAFPEMAELDEDVFEAEGEELFEFGLSRLLDGFEQLIAHAATRTEPPAPRKGGCPPQAEHPAGEQHRAGEEPPAEEG